MSDGLPFGVSREDIERHMAENGVTRCPSAQYRPHPTAEESRRMQEQLEEMKRLGQLLNDGLGKGPDWKEQITRDVRSWRQRANDARAANIRAKYRVLFDRGLNDEQIAHHLGVEPRTVRKMAQKMGVDLERATPPKTGGPHPNETKREYIRELWKQGLPTKEIAQKVGSHPRTVLDTFRRMGLQPNIDQARLRIDKRELVKLFNRGDSYPEIAKHFGVGTSSILRALQRMGLRRRDG